MGNGPNNVGLSRKNLREALDASLERLGVEHINLYWMHAFDALTPLDETLRFSTMPLQRQDRLLRVLQFAGLAADQSGLDGQGQRL